MTRPLRAQGDVGPLEPNRLESRRTARPRDGAPRDSFTLIELLVVIAVIALLAGMLLPAIRRGATSGRIQTTRALISQVGMAISQYQGEFGDTPLLSKDYPSVDHPSSSYLWAYLVGYNTGLIPPRAPYLTVKDSFKFDYNKKAELVPGAPDIEVVILLDGFAQPLIYDPYEDPAKFPSYYSTLHYPIHNPKTYDLFSAGAYASQIPKLGNDFSTPEKAIAFENPTTEGVLSSVSDKDGNRVAYKYDQYSLDGAINKFIGNW